MEILKQTVNTDNSWVKINLLTGRTHQIRAQTSAMKAPIMGDTLYGAKLPYSGSGIALRACEIEFMWNDRACQYKLTDEF